jgi:hypothetical protein
VFGLLAQKQAKLRAGKGTQRVMSQRPPDARITGGMVRILLNPGRNAKSLLGAPGRSAMAVPRVVAAAGAAALALAA